MEKACDEWSPIQRVAVQPWRKESVHLHTFLGKLRFPRTWAALSRLMLSKKPEMSNRRRAPVLLVAYVA
jgi:hypothetical protein